MIYFAQRSVELVDVRVVARGERSGAGTLLSAVETLLWRTEAQLIEGRKVTALFGGFPERNHQTPPRRDARLNLDATSGAPMVNARPEPVRSSR